MYELSDHSKNRIALKQGGIFEKRRGTVGQQIQVLN